MHPPPTSAWANFTLMMECTPESSRYYFVLCGVKHLKGHINETLFLIFFTALTTFALEMNVFIIYFKFKGIFEFKIEQKLTHPLISHLLYTL